ncbi:hypothetical protein LBMAG56_48490 [Verrucomicrobiota bacterium]|nr:hypothetical protein LBMAG56_48490 [Verrucomicrobiota bacterium]
MLLAGVMMAGAQAILPEGFFETQVRGLTSPTAMAVGPNGWILVCEQSGTLRLIRDGALRTQPFYQVDAQAFQERGLDGVQFDPGFASNRWIYIYYTAKTPTLHNRLSRITAGENSAVAGSEVVLMDLPTLGVSGWHNGGCIVFGPDDKLYLGVGDNNIGALAQRLDTVLGKVLRLNRDGTIPADNPFAATAEGASRAIWALGFRNPFTLAFQPGTGRLFANDVGLDTWEEINEVVRGGNYGWPVYEGPANDPNFNAPIHAFRHPADVNASSAITGGAFYNPATNQFPAEFVGKYFFTDGFTQVINVLDPETRAVTNFATFPPFPPSGPDVTPLYLTVAADGSLYYIARNQRALNRIQYGVSPMPRVGGQPVDQLVVVGEAVRFKVTAYGREPLAYQWERKAAGQANYTAIAGATQPEYALGAANIGDDNAQFRCVVTNPFGAATSRAARLRVLADTPPVPVIVGPVEGATYRAGDTIAFSGFGTDREDGRLAAGQLSWRIDFQHHDHSHPFVPDTRGIEGGSFTIPTSGETSDNVWYRIYLTATDAAGISRTVLRDVLPVKSAITLDTVPPGLAVLLDGAEVSAPFVFVGVAGIERVLEARSQMANGVAYEFESWSDGGAATHTIGTPGRDATLVARFRALAPEADAAEFVSQSVTNEMVGGAPYPVTVVLRNTGTTTWTTAGNYFLASQNPPDSTTWGLTRVALAGPVPPGALATLNFTVTAPGTVGTNDMQWQMVRDGFYYFGALTPNVVVRVAELANDAWFIAQSVPATMVVGQLYDVTVTMRNNGANAWTAAELYRLSSQRPEENDTWGTSRVELEQTTPSGANATFRFTVTAPPAPGLYDFQWRMIQDGVAWFGEFSSNVVVQVTALPEIRSQPADVTVMVGEAAAFGVTAIAPEPPTYQWLRDDRAIPGATAAGYRIAATTTGDDGARFSCVVSSLAGSVTSRAAVLRVTRPPAPEIRTQPADVTLKAGEAASFSVTAVGTPPLSYQWLRDDRAIPGATAAAYRIAATTTGDDGARFSCVVSNLGGSVTSRAAVLRVTPLPPEIRGQPADVTVRTGQSATFTLTAVGPGPLSYQWRCNDRMIPGATAAVFRIAAAMTRDDGAKFSCVVSNLGGSVTSRAAVLRVTNPPVPVVTRVSPARGAVAVSANATITVSFSVPMQAGTLTPGRFYLQKAGTSALVPAVVTYDNGTRTATLRPLGGLDPAGALYQVVLRGGANGVKSLEGATLAGDVSWGFRTADIVPPAVVSYAPGAGAVVAERPVITLTFSEALNEASIIDATLTLREAGEPRLIAAYLAYDAGTRTLTLVPAKKLKKHKTYVVTLLGGWGGITDFAGNRLRENFVFAFTVGGEKERK